LDRDPANELGEQVAAKKGLKDAVDLLIEYGADLNNIPQDAQGMALTGREGPLVGACRNNDLDMAQFLLERGADPNIDNIDNGCPLSCAVNSAGNFQLVELLLDYGADIGLKQDIFEQAVFAGEKMISRLLQQPTTTEDRKRYLDQALQSAAYWAILEMCVWLLDQGANPNYRGGRWGCPLTAAIANDQMDYSAGINNRRLIIDLLLQRGADVNPGTIHTGLERNLNVKGDTFPTPLAAALQNGSMSTANRILEAGADPNIPGGDLHLPLQTAARFCRAMVEPLLAAGAEVNAVGGATYGTALHAAAYAHNVDGIKLLLAHGVDATITAGKYGSVLQAAAKRVTVSSGGWSGWRSVPAMKLLVAAGADVHTRCGKYGSVLQMAAKSGNLKAVRWLIEEMGVDVNVKGGRFGSVRAAAVMKGRWGVVSYLERKFGKFKWGGEADKYGKWKGWVEE
jgi:ankyrin repeat protein